MQSPREENGILFYYNRFPRMARSAVCWYQLCKKVKWETRFYYAILCNPGLYVPGNAPFLFFAAYKTDSGGYDLPLSLTFSDPMDTPGLMLAPSMAKGFKF